jgi:mRNA-degrading endonuclease RelE of RelBE toxin-antitoxin system
MIYSELRTFWVVTEHTGIEKDFRKLPKRIIKSYYLLVDALKDEGPYPRNWDSKQLHGRAEIRIRLGREYRVLLTVVGPNIFIVKVAHRKDVYR